ncbi:MAG: cache domain-containing protein [Oligoflexia bacterium]|nr:cache domain-containing protein [Oligoflexia bacterium]
MIPTKNLRPLLLTAALTLVASLPMVLLFLFYTLPAIGNRITQAKQDSTRIAVESAFGILEGYHAKATSGILPLEQAQREAASAISKLRYSGEEYFWLNDTQPKMIMHPFKPELDGKDLSDNKDPNGKLLFKEMVRVATSSGDGFVDYMWPKQGHDTPVPKISYVKLFKPWNWIIGSGVYVDDVQAEISAFRSKNLIYFTVAFLVLIAMSLGIGMRQLVGVVIPVQTAMQKLKEESGKLTNTASDVSQASMSLANAGETLGSAVQETAAAITEMNEMIHRTTSDTDRSSAVADETKLLATKGQEAMREMTGAIEQIAGSNESVIKVITNNSEKMASLTQIIGEIRAKTQIINDIVFQTKLLSFNASVEAARAGEHGKGFAVVAEEVGKLAQMSGDSAAQIAEIIDKSTRAVQEISVEIQSSAQALLTESKARLEQGQSVADRCRAILDEVATKAAESSERSGSIRSAAQEQTRGSEEIGKALAQLERTNESNEKTYAKTAQHAGELLEQARQLQTIVAELGGVVRADS